MSAAPDPTMEAITAAVLTGREGRTDTARTELLTIWSRIGTDGDALHRCTLAHYLADLYDHPAEALIWDVRALDAAQALTDERAQRHHAELRMTGFLPSLYLNMADNLRRLRAFDSAADQLTQADRHRSALPTDAYGDMIRTALDEVRLAIGAHDSTRRVSSPDPTG